MCHVSLQCPLFRALVYCRRRLLRLVSEREVELCEEREGRKRCERTLPGWVTASFYVRRMTAISNEMYHVAMRCWLMRLCMRYLQFKSLSLSVWMLG